VLEICGRAQNVPTLQFDPIPKNIYFGLELIMAMVEGALTRAGVQHGN
jgi:hypothetical protein